MPAHHSPAIGRTALITGAGGEMGHGLISRLHALGTRIVTLDIAQLDADVEAAVDAPITGSVTDAPLVEQVFDRFAIDEVFHLAALLSTTSEREPDAAHTVNVEGTRVLLSAAQRHGTRHQRDVRFIYPSSIAVYGVPGDKDALPPVREDEWTHPITIYGCNKLYCEHLGRYFSAHHQLLTPGHRRFVDFRCVRFPGLISATTMPAGGTSDYAPEMLHAAAGGTPYACFARPDTRIPFMAMVDAIEALLRLSAAPRRQLSRVVYNLAAFSPSAEELRLAVLEAFPDAALSWRLDPSRQQILDSWPALVNDRPARDDWGFAPKYGFDSALRDHLIPGLVQQYRFAL